MRLTGKVSAPREHDHGLTERDDQGDRRKGQDVPHVGGGVELRICDRADDDHRQKGQREGELLDPDRGQLLADRLGQHTSAGDLGGTAHAGPRSSSCSCICAPDVRAISVR